ncbi:hypothetical protein RND81_10G178200, partial [Saponaria officinalis]
TQDRTENMNVENDTEENEVTNEVFDNEINENNEKNNSVSPCLNSSFVNIYEPKMWDNLDLKMRDLLIEKGPIREINLKYPKDDKNRRFSTFYYERKLRNNEIIDRHWLVYSKELNKVFCFCCKVVKKIHSKSFLASIGVDDWVHLGEKLKQHEESHEHVQNLKDWAELGVRLRSNKTIDKEIQEQIKKDTEHWKQVMIRIISVIKRLAMNNLAFRGSNDKVYDDSNEIFLGFLETIAEFDQTLQ